MCKTTQCFFVTLCNHSFHVTTSLLSFSTQLSTEGNLAPSFYISVTTRMYCHKSLLLFLAAMTRQVEAESLVNCH